MAYDKAKTHTKILKSSEIHTATASYSRFLRVGAFRPFKLEGFRDNGFWGRMVGSTYLNLHPELLYPTLLNLYDA